jgi:alpha-beta hydrolase superfamily lysophospholipase
VTVVAKAGAGGHNGAMGLRGWLWWLVCLVVGGSGALWADDDPTLGVRTAIQGEWEDFTAPHWDRRTPGWAETPGVFAPAAGPAVERYRQQLVKQGDWKAGPVWHQLGTLPLARPGKETERLGVNVFFPPGPSVGTLLFVHGYLSHAANFAYTFRWFTARGWTVVTLDLPGHGVSTGPRGDADSFAEYGDAVTLWLHWVKDQGWPGPTVLVAHSLGTAAAFEALRRPGTPVPQQIVFCAPLLRTNWFSAATLGSTLGGVAGDRAPLTFGWDGYLDGYQLPLHWIQELGRWLEALDNQGPLALPLTVFAGDHDSIVATNWNLAEYRRLVPGIREVVLAGKDHLFLSDAADRQAFHELLDETLSPRDVTWSREVSLPVTLGSGTTIPVSVKVLEAPASRGTLLFVHGFGATPGEFGALVHRFADHGWTVTAVELPGHGASGGPREDVADFADYGDAVQAWLAWVRAQGWPGPTVLVAHSLGGSATLEALRRPGAWVPDRLMFCAPLLRTRWHEALAVGTKVPGVPYGHWFQALDLWLGRLEAQGPLNLPLTVYSGTNDSVVDGDRNRAEWRRLVPGYHDVVLAGADHWFLEEPGPREEFLDRIGAELGW